MTIIAILIILFSFYQIHKIRNEYEQHIRLVHQMVIMRDLIFQMNYSIGQEKCDMKTLVEMKKMLCEGKDVLIYLKEYNYSSMNKEVNNFTDYFYKRTLALISVFEETLKKTSGL